MLSEVLSHQKVNPEDRPLTTKKQQYLKYTKEQKQEFINLLLQEDQCLEDLSQKLGIKLHAARFFWKEYKKKQQIKSRKRRILKKKKQFKSEKNKKQTVIEFQKSLTDTSSYINAHTFFKSFIKEQTKYDNLDKSQNAENIDFNQFSQIKEEDKTYCQDQTALLKGSCFDSKNGVQFPPYNMQQFPFPSPQMFMYVPNYNPYSMFYPYQTQMNGMLPFMNPYLQQQFSGLS